MAAEELGNIYKKIALGKGKSYEFLFSLEGLFLSVMEFDPVTDETLPVTIDDILQGISEFDFQKIRWQNDRLQHIVNFSSSAVRNLIEILHEKNLREHRITRPEQIHEVDSRSMMWLAKKPGFSIKQKIASEQRMMGVYHTTSLDTAENRLFKAFMLKLDELLLEKENACRKQNLTLSEDSERFVSIVHRWLKSDEASFIGKWNNTVPNNTLLNDKNYRKIWKAHLALQNLDEQIQEDLERLQIIKNNALFWISAAKLNLSDDIRFRQTVAFPDYSTFSLIKDRIGLFGFARDDSDNQWKKFTVSLDEKFLLSLQENQSEYSLPDDVENFEGISCFSEQVVANFFPNKSFDAEVAKSLNSQKDSLSVNSVAAVDLNSVLPSYLCDNGNGVKRFTKKLIHQQIKELPCTSSRSKLIFTKSKSIQTFSIHSVFDANLRSVIDSDEDKRGIEKACADFAETIKQETLCQKCIYITSDDIDDFSPTVNAFKQSMNSAFLKTEILPKSIAALFSKYSDILNKFIDGDVLTVRSIYDDYEVQTKVRIRFDKELSEKNPKTKGITFQRLGVTRLENPNTDLERNNIIPQNMKRIITLQDSVLLSGNFSVDSFHFEIKEKQNKIPHGQNEICLYTFENSASGALEYDRLQSITSEIPLWCDFLPKLSMVDSSGKQYVLVEPNKVSIRPVVGKPVRIPISRKFSFPAKKKFYEFPLSQGEKKEKSKYFAFIKDSSFPLENETKCSLYLTYTYGMPRPYNLEFIPTSDSAEFKSAVVKWENKSHKDNIHDMPVPNFVREYTWADMKTVLGRKSERGDISNLTEEWLPTEFKKIEKLANGNLKVFKILEAQLLDSQNNAKYSISISLQNGRIFRQDFDPKRKISDGTEIICEFSEKTDNFGRRSERINPYRTKLADTFLKSIRFPAVTVWNNGRSIFDDDCPESFRIQTQEALNAIEKTFVDPNLPDSIKHEYKFFLSCLHNDMPDWFLKFIPKILEQIDKHYDYPNWIAYALGDCSMDWQKDLLSKTIELLDDKSKAVYAIRILAKALWRVNSFVFNLNEGAVKKILSAIKKILNSFNEQSRLKPSEKTVRLSACLECIIALCRLRATTEGFTPNDNILALLSPSANEVTRHIVGILQSLKETDMKIKTFLTFEIDRPSNDKTPELLYVAYGYLSGKIDSNAIKVLEADFGD